METGVFVYYIYRPCWSGRYQFQIPVRTNQTGLLVTGYHALSGRSKLSPVGRLGVSKVNFLLKSVCWPKINLLPILTYAEPSACKGTVSGLFQLVIDIGLLVKSCDCNTSTNLCNITYNYNRWAGMSRRFPGSVMLSFHSVLVLHSDLVTSSSIRWSRVDNFLFAPPRCRRAFFEQKCVLRLRCVTYFHVHVFLRCSRTS